MAVSLATHLEQFVQRFDGQLSRLEKVQIPSANVPTPAISTPTPTQDEGAALDGGAKKEEEESSHPEQDDVTKS